MKVIGKKIMAILMCMLLIAMIPIAVGATTDDDDKGTTDIGRTIIRGFFFNLKPAGLKYQFFALRVHYTEMTGTETTMGIVRMQRCQVGVPTGGYVRAGPMGMFGYMFMATFKGGIDVM